MAVASAAVPIVATAAKLIAPVVDDTVVGVLIAVIPPIKISPVVEVAVIGPVILVIEAMFISPVVVVKTVGENKLAVWVFPRLVNPPLPALPSAATLVKLIPSVAEIVIEPAI